MTAIEIRDLVLQELDMDTDHHREYLTLPHSTSEYLDALSIIFKLSEYDGQSLNDTAREIKCTKSKARRAINRFYKMIDTHWMLNQKFERCTKIYLQLNEII